MDGGRAAGSEGRYPELAERDGQWEVHTEHELDWPAPAAIVPVVNLSLGPPSAAHPMLLNDIVNLATLGLSARDCLVVAAAGNCGELGEQTVSAWAAPDWVLAVGATEDAAGTRLAPYSGRGAAEDPASGPDVVAHGTISTAGGH